MEKILWRVWPYVCLYMLLAVLLYVNVKLISATVNLVQQERQVLILLQRQPFQWDEKLQLPQLWPLRQLNGIWWIHGGKTSIEKWTAPAVIFDSNAYINIYDVMWSDGYRIWEDNHVHTVYQQRLIIYTHDTLTVEMLLLAKKKQLCVWYVGICVVLLCHLIWIHLCGISSKPGLDNRKGL